MLHLVCNSIGLSSCKKFVRVDDVVIFLGEATGYAKGMECSGTYAIESDSVDGGSNPPQGVEWIGYDRFVDLVVEHTTCVTWS